GGGCGARAGRVPGRFSPLKQTPEAWEKRTNVRGQCQVNLRTKQFRKAKFPATQTHPAIPFSEPSPASSQAARRPPPLPAPFVLRTQKPSDEHPLDLRRPLPDLLDLDVPPAPPDRKVLHEPQPPMNPHRVV